MHSALATHEGANPLAPHGYRHVENQQNQSARNNPSRESLEGNAVGNQRHSVDGNFPAAHGRSSPAFRLTQAQWRMKSRASFWKHVREEHPDHPFPAQVIAKDVECSPKTAQSWLDGKATPAGILDLRAMAAIPAYAALKGEIADLESSLDPRVQRKLHELHRLMTTLADDPRAVAAVNREASE